MSLTAVLSQKPAFGNGIVRKGKTRQTQANRNNIKFSLGDNVTVGNSPRMKVGYIYPDGDVVTCIWFTQAGEYLTADFGINLMTKVA
jgi:uncharacterized protein YodC (DUF2158 family)